MHACIFVTNFVNCDIKSTTFKVIYYTISFRFRTQIFQANLPKNANLAFKRIFLNLL